MCVSAEKIQISENTKLQLDRSGCFDVELRGCTEVKVIICPMLWYSNGTDNNYVYFLLIGYASHLRFTCVCTIHSSSPSSHSYSHLFVETISQKLQPKEGRLLYTIKTVMVHRWTFQILFNSII